jgi:two-component system, NarL family, response regulator EvgA
MIVDDHPLIRLVVRSLLEREKHIVVAETDNGIDACTLAGQLMPDLIILDLTLPTLSGLEVIARFKALNLRISILVLTAHNPAHFAARCMKAGAAGFVSKQDDLSDLIDALTAIFSGYTYFPNLKVQLNHHDSRHLNESEQLRNITNRELMVLQHLTEGMLNKDIAKRMLISEKTVSTYKTRLLRKLNANSLLELIELAKRNPIVNGV